MILEYPRHFKHSHQISWHHHRSGWGYVTARINKELASPAGPIVLEAFADGYFRHEKKIQKPWVGFLHNAPYHPPVVKELYPNVPAMADIIRLPGWRASMPHCRGLYVLSDYARDFLAARVDVPVERLWHPTQLDVPKFDFAKFDANEDKRVLSIGHWMRNFESFGALRTPHRKVLIRPYRGVPISCSDAEVIDWVGHEVYDALLTQNVVFVDLYDASANNVIIECIARHTPIMVNRIAPVVEYLGEGYPFYFEDLAEAGAKLADRDAIAGATAYLAALDKSRLDISDFLKSIVVGNIYRGL